MPREPIPLLLGLIDALMIQIDRTEITDAFVLLLLFFLLIPNESV